MPQFAVCSAALLLFFATLGDTMRVKHQRRSNASQAKASTRASCGSCDDIDNFMWWEAWNPLSSIGANDLVFGHPGGVCCRTRNRMLDRANELMSASKMMSGYTMLKLVDEGLLSLNTKAADIFDWWNATDGRKNVELHHLMSQTAGLTKYPLGTGICVSGLGGGTLQCAQVAYEELFPSTFTEPGLEFEYVESTFYVMSAMALHVTGLETWDEVFQKYLARPLGVDSDWCHFDFPTRHMAFAGGGLRCATLELGKILQAISAKTVGIRNMSLYDEAERPHTLNARRSPGHISSVPGCSSATEALGCSEAFMPEWAVGRWPLNRDTPGIYWHYGLCQYIECSTPNCDGGILRMSSRGMMGTYPWVDRGVVSGHRPHWGVAVRFRPISGNSIWDIETEVLPRAARAIQD